MKWPFVRRSKYESVIKERDEQKGYKEWWIEQSNILIAQTNRLNQELANELNNHRETKKKSQQRLDAYDCLSKELQETKDALSIAQEDTRQHRMSLDLADEKEEKIRQYLLKVINYL